MHIGTQTLEDDNKELAALEDAEEGDRDQQLAHTLTAVARGVRRRSGTGKRLSNAERRTMAAALIKLLLQPTSPHESDEEEEGTPSL